MLRIWETQVTASKVTVEIYMMRVIIWQLLMLYFIHKRKGWRKVWGTWIPFLTQIRAAEAEVGIKTSPLLIYNVIGRTRLYLQPRAVFTTFFFFFFLCLLCSLRGSGYPHFMHCWNAITIVASSLQNSFSFLRSGRRWGLARPSWGSASDGFLGWIHSLLLYFLTFETAPCDLWSFAIPSAPRSGKCNPGLFISGLRRPENASKALSNVL